MHALRSRHQDVMASAPPGVCCADEPVREQLPAFPADGGRSDALDRDADLACRWRLRAASGGARTHALYQHADADLRITVGCQWPLRAAAGSELARLSRRATAGSRSVPAATVE